MARRNLRFSRPLAGRVLICWMLAWGLLAGAPFAGAPLAGAPLAGMPFAGAPLAGLPFWQTASAAATGGGGFWTWPVNGELLTPFRNGDDPYAAGQHRGIDIAAAAGTPVHATTGGSVSYAGHLPDNGICATVRTADGRYLVSYLHLSSLAVRRGDAVGTGSVIGLSGTTGKRSAPAPHLHLSVRPAAGGAYLDPLPLLGPRTARPTGTEESDGTATPLSAAPPAAGETGAQNDTQHAQGRNLPDARERARPRANTHTRGHTQHSQSGNPGNRRTNVHAHSPGDSVTGARPEAAVDSARESHVPRGHVAPPPLSAAHTRLTVAAPSSENDGSNKLLTSQPDSTSSSSGDSSRSYLIFTAIAALLALAMFLLRRRPGADAAPAGAEPEIVIARRDAVANGREQQAHPQLHAVEQ